MRALLFLLLLLGLQAPVQAAEEVSGRIIKVLPFLLDQQGRNATSPSLFDRDAYQAFLRENPTNISAIRFDVLWKAKPAATAPLKLTVELRGTGANNAPKLTTLEAQVTPGWFRHWAHLPLAGPAYREFGKVTAWRVSLWDGTRRLSEQHSFLW